MGWKTCPECHWPLDLSSECCAICGGIAWEQPVTDGEAPKEPYVINGRGDVWKRCTPHILAGIFAIIGWLVFPPKLFALQLLITGGYLAAVGVWTYRLAMTNSRTYEPRNLHQEAGWCGAGAIAVILLAGSLFTKDGHATDGLRQRGSRTLEYWNQISQLERQANTKTPEALVASLQGIIVSLERLDSTGVDPDAVDYLFRKIQVFRKLIAHNERFQSLSILVESFLRGAMGDPFGTTKEMNDSEREIQQDLEQLVIDRKRLAAVFAARYSLTFQ